MLMMALLLNFLLGVPFGNTVGWWLLLCWVGAEDFDLDSIIWFAFGIIENWSTFHWVICSFLFSLFFLFSLLFVSWFLFLFIVCLYSCH